MSSPGRRSVRLHAGHHDELENPKDRVVPVIDVPQDSQQRLPKSESIEAPVNLPIAKPPVRVPITNSNFGDVSELKNRHRHLSDTQISRKLDWHMRRSAMDKRVGDASRTILYLSGMWPWEFAAGFMPKKWSITLLEDIRRLLRSVCKSARCNGPGPHTKIVQNFLLGCARRRDTHCPQLEHSDVLDALDHFSADFYTKREPATPVHTTPASSQTRQIIVLVPEAQSESDESEDDQDEAIEIPDSEGECEDWTGHTLDDDIEPAVHNEMASPVVKRSRSSSLPVLPEKRSRTTGPSNPYIGCNDTIGQDTVPPGVTCDSTNAIVVQDAASQTDTIPVQRTKNFEDIIGEFEVIEIEKRKQLDAVTLSLHEITMLIEDSEAHEDKLGSDKVEKLFTDVKSYETERDKIIKGKRFVEEHREDMAMSADDFEKAMHNYTVKLEEYDRLIAQANSDVLEELGAIAQKDFDLRAKQKRLKTHGQELLQEVQYSNAIKTLMRLGPSGMVTLLAKLEARDISLVTMAEDVMIEHAVESLDDLFDNDETQ
ncbi:hypothetical protein FLONG3_245 [Fusarium longipes]|uniref:Uncharacterized protein n=1 Tax=Fusarium longipes TaxID=694270 RepID=A0A395TBJ3_9HYPO|nr:hypothetical protein FLONG3_245 [Fusarium longipes]